MGHFPMSDDSDLTNYRLGITRQYTYGESFDKAVAEGVLKPEVVGDDKQNILKLHGGRIDAFPMEVEVGYNLIRQELAADQAALITHHENLVQETPIAVVISKNIGKERADLLLRVLNKGLKQLRQSGRYDQMLQDSRAGKYISS